MLVEFVAVLVLASELVTNTMHSFAKTVVMRDLVTFLVDANGHLSLLS